MPANKPILLLKKRILLLTLFVVLLLVGITPLAAQEATSEATSEAITCEAGFRLFDHEYLAGEPICIPENPQRILALELSAIEAVALAGKELVGTANWLHEEVPVLLPELASALEGTADTGYPGSCAGCRAGLDSGG